MVCACVCVQLLKALEDGMAEYTVEYSSPYFSGPPKVVLGPPGSKVRPWKRTLLVVGLCAAMGSLFGGCFHKIGVVCMRDTGLAVTHRL